MALWNDQSTIILHLLSSICVWSLKTDHINHNCSIVRRDHLDYHRHHHHRHCHHLLMLKLWGNTYIYNHWYDHHHHHKIPSSWLSIFIFWKDCGLSFVPARRKVSNGGWFKSDVCNSSRGYQPARKSSSSSSSRVYRTSSQEIERQILILARMFMW